MRQMTKTNKIFSAVAGAAMAVGSIAGTAQAQDARVTPVAQTGESLWTDELREFDRAATAARNYALENNGVGILVHVGTSAAERGTEHNIANNFVKVLANPSILPQLQTKNSKGETVSFLEQECPDVDPASLEGLEGVSSKYFLSYNDVPGTGFTFYEGHMIVGAEDRTEVKGFNDAVCAIPEIIKGLPIAKRLQEIELSSAEPLTPALD